MTCITPWQVSGHLDLKFSQERSKILVLLLQKKGILKGYALADKFMASQKSIMPLENLSKHESVYFFAKYESLILEGDDIKIPIEQCAKIWNTITKIPYQMTLYDDFLGLY
ncbi:MAG: hypothetical protein CM1200mP38_7170 [Dehalococcoidia bacterium]|nr:MAG: hypothetical protein CM1200mP38_7170 [Dehalococcoidia bacterium]